MNRKLLITAIFAHLFHLLFFINYSSGQWEQASNGIGTNHFCNSLANRGNELFVGCDSGLFRSSDGGLSWNSILITPYVEAVAVNGNNIFAGTAGWTPTAGIYSSSNNGTNWSHTSLNNLHIYAITCNGNNVFAGTVNGIYRSTNNGINWTQTSLNSIQIKCLAVNSGNVYTGGCNGIYLSTNNGNNWDQIFMSGACVLSIAINGNSIFAGTGGSGGGVFLSTNNGSNWTQTALNNRCSSLVISGNTIIAGTEASSGIYLSTNNGTNWIPKNQGFTIAPRTLSLIISNNYVFAGTELESVWRRSMSEIVAIQNIGMEVPTEFSLEQNYPNPFNPITNIEFSLPEKSFVKLKVFDISGRQINDLVNENLSVGTYKVDFDGSNNSSGVYFYTLETDKFIETKRMVLLK